MEPERFLDVFSKMPDVSEAQRTGSTAERVQMLKQLGTFMVPLRRHVAVAMELDSLLFSGYVGREPQTREHLEKLQTLYEDELFCKDGTPLALEDALAQQAKLIIGVSGMGKTRFTKRWASTFPRVIFHAELNLYQIPVLHIELPSNGASVAGLCNAIFQTVDKLIPAADYLQSYALKGKPSAETLIQRAASVLHRHCVGILICDELQNLTNVGKGKQTLMTELVTMSNVLGLPMVFIGTNKAQALFGLDFRTSRRVSGQGSEHWDRLLDEAELPLTGGFDEAGTPLPGQGVNEWRDFIEVLWSCQWNRKVAPLTEVLSAAMYDASQGVIDVAIKLFAAMQARAILDGTEELSVELLADVYQREFILLHPMLDALRRDDRALLASFQDIRPLAMDSMLSQLQRRASAATSRAFSVKPRDPDFVAHVATALTAAGFDQDASMQTAKQVAEENKAGNLLAAVKRGTAMLQPRKSLAGKSRKTPTAAAPEDYSARPGDLRLAFQSAKESGRRVRDELTRLGLVQHFDEVLQVS